MLRPLLFAALLGGCHVDLNDPGTDPPVRQLYFPSGLAFDTVHRDDGHDDRYLYVTNGNADLRFGGGLIQLVDLNRFDCAVGRWCEQVGPCPQKTDGTPVLTAQATCDLGLADKDLAYQPFPNVPECQLDPIDPSVVDCDETPFIVGNASVRVGNFAGAIRVHKKSQTDRRLFVAVRGDPSVTYVDADLASLQTGVMPPPGVFNCFDHPETLTTRAGYDPATNRVLQAAGCDSSHVISTFDCGDRLDCKQNNPTQIDPNKTTVVLPTEPFGMQLDTGTLADGSDYARILVSHLATGQVSLIDATQNDNQYAVLDVSPPFFSADTTGRRGAFGIAPMHPHDPSSLWYMTSNLQPILATFRVAQVGVVVPSLSFSIGGAFALGIDVRDIVFEPGGNRAFLTENNPPSLLVLDTRITPDRNPGQPLNQLVDIVDVCQTPSHMGVRRQLVPGATGTPNRVQTDIYVVCFLENQVMVVDPDAPVVEDTILVGRGPNDVVFNFGDTDDPDAPPPPPNRRAYISQYSEMSIGVIDLDPGSPTKNRMIARIGKPLPPPDTSGQASFPDINYNTKY